MSAQVEALFERRREATGGKGYVFPSESKAGHLGDPRKTLLKVREASGTTFTNHDLRRTFSTIAEGLDLSAYALKRLLNHATDDDVTAGYIVHNPERLRSPMQRISDEIDRLAGPPSEVVQIIAHDPINEIVQIIAQ